MRFLHLDFGKGFRKTSFSNIFETRHGSEKTVGPQALGPFLDAGLLRQRLRRLQACVPTKELDFKAQESLTRPIESSKTEGSNIPSDDQPLRAWSSLPGPDSLKVRNSVGASSLPARPIETSKTERSNIPSDDQPLRVWSSLPGLDSLKVRNSVGATIRGRPIESFKIEGSNIPSDDQPLRVWSSLPGLDSLKVRNSVGATIRGRPIEFSPMNFDSFHRLSRRLSPTGGLSLQITST